VNQKDIQLGFIGLAKQNNELMNFNTELNIKLDETLEELDRLKKEREKKAIRKEARANRNRLPTRQSMTIEIYNLLIEEAAVGPNYKSVRLRIAFCLLLVTGVRINELLTLKVYQLQTLLKYHWIAIDRSKGGPSSHKAFLTPEGKKVVKERERDFKFLFHMKTPDLYVFTSELHRDKMLRRETITRDVNILMLFVSRSLPDQPLITSDSFRIGYISKLWIDTQKEH
jgi:integrase